MPESVPCAASGEAALLYVSEGKGCMAGNCGRRRQSDDISESEGFRWALPTRPATLAHKYSRIIPRGTRESRLGGKPRFIPVAPLSAGTVLNGGGATGYGTLKGKKRQAGPQGGQAGAFPSTRPRVVPVFVVFYGLFATIRSASRPCSCFSHVGKLKHLSVGFIVKVCGRVFRRAGMPCIPFAPARHSLSWCLRVRALFQV